LFKIEKGYYVPKNDTECIKVVFDVTDLLPALALVDKFDCVIQAGGNFGVWANFLSDKFRHVYTFEPDPLNFSALCKNIGDVQNIIKFNSALGCDHEAIALNGREANAGAHFVSGKGIIPTLKIDDLGIEPDLIVLDIEGYELKALIGGKETIQKFKPVIHFEDKGLSEKYGIAQGEAEKWLEQFGYKVRARIKRDVICAVS